MHFSDFTRKSGFLFVASHVGSFVQYIFQAMMIRMLTGPEYALMNTLLGVLGVVSSPAAVFQMDLIRRAAFAANSQDIPAILWMAKRTLIRVMPYSVMVILILYFMRHSVAEFFNTSDARAIGATAAGILIVVMGAIAMGFFWGMQWFRFLGVIALVAAALRVTLGYLLVKLGMGATGAVLATVVCGLVPLACFGWLMCDFRSASPSVLSEKKEEGVFWLTMMVIGTSAVLVQMDLILVKHYFPSGEAATQFATAGIFGRAMVAFLGPLAMAIIPLSTAQTTRLGEDRNRVFWQCLKLCLALGIIAASMGGFLANEALALMKGKELSNAEKLLLPETARLLRYYLWAMLPIALVTVTMNHVLALRSWRLAGQAAVLTAIYPLGIVFWHGSLRVVLLVDFVFGSLILFILLWQLYRESMASQNLMKR